MQNRTHDHCLPSPYEFRQPPLTSQPQHQPHGPACLVILPLWLEMGGGGGALCVLSVYVYLYMYVYVCVCVCFVCVCVCIIKDTLVTLFTLFTSFYL